MYSETLSKLAAPFDPGKVTWYPVISRSDCTICRFEPYVQWRSYIERLNAVLTPAGWEQQPIRLQSAPRRFSRCGDRSGVYARHPWSWILPRKRRTRADEARAAMRAEEESLKDACFRFGLGPFIARDFHSRGRARPTASLENGSRSDRCQHDHRSPATAAATISRSGLHNRACEKGYRRPSLSRRASADRPVRKAARTAHGPPQPGARKYADHSAISPGSEVPDRWHSLAETSPMPASGPEKLATNAIIRNRAFTTSCKGLLAPNETRRSSALRLIPLFPLEPAEDKDANINPVSISCTTIRAAAATAIQIALARD